MPREHEELSGEWDGVPHPERLANVVQVLMSGRVKEDRCDVVGLRSTRS
jgi:hypothetical protein